MNFGGGGYSENGHWLPVCEGLYMGVHMCEGVHMCVGMDVGVAYV